MTADEAIQQARKQVQHARSLVRFNSRIDHYTALVRADELVKVFRILGLRVPEEAEATLQALIEKEAK